MSIGDVPDEDYDLVEDFFEHQLSVAARTSEERARWAQNDMSCRKFRPTSRRPLSLAWREGIEEKFDAAFMRPEEVS